MASDDKSKKNSGKGNNTTLAINSFRGASRMKPSVAGISKIKPKIKKENKDK